MLDLIREIGADIRHIALELRPTTLDDLGLRCALANYVGEWSERTRIEVDFHDGLGQGGVPPQVETAVYRVVQEALTNVLAHARASRVTLILERRPDHLLTIVEDDGRGFDYEAVMGGSDSGQRLGLLGMEERVAALRGDLQVETSPGVGTSLFVRIALPENGR